MAKRSFPPLYVPSGDLNTDRLAFFHVLERLKTQKRTGWIDHNVPNPESISDHMYRMAILAMCTSDATLDVPKCVMMCVVHDLAEAQGGYPFAWMGLDTHAPSLDMSDTVGDITPREGISKEEKRRLEAEAMHNFVHDMLHASPAALRIEALYKEYEEGMTPEAKFVKGTYSTSAICVPLNAFILTPVLHWPRLDLDRLEMALQAREYEKAHARDRGDLQGFFDSSLPYLRHPEVRHWGDTLASERDGDLPTSIDVDGHSRIAP
ncbi:HD domain-containing protein [Boletus edulis]|nr:HD domain-containing protein [Boletus edulis]